jgi:hypothetical protein
MPGTGLRYVSLQEFYTNLEYIFESCEVDLVYKILSTENRCFIYISVGATKTAGRRGFKEWRRTVFRSFLTYSDPGSGIREKNNRFKKFKRIGLGNHMSEPNKPGDPNKPEKTEN